MKIKINKNDSVIVGRYQEAEDLLKAHGYDKDEDYTLMDG